MAKAQWDAAATQQLHRAAASGDAAQVAAALAAGANPCALSPEDDNPPVIAAAVGGHTAAVSQLLAALGAQRTAQARPSDGKTLLHVATEEGHLQVVELALAAQPGLALVPDMDGWLPLHWAAYLGDAACARCLLGAGAPQQQVGGETLGGETPLALALQMVGSQWGRHASDRASDFAAVLELLHANGGRVAEWRSARDGGTALHEVVRNGGPPACIHRLCALGTPLDATTRDDSGSVTALHLAAAMGCVDQARALLEAGAALEAREPEQAATPLLLAAQAGAGPLLTLLLEHNADAWAQDARGMTAPAILLLSCDDEAAALTPLKALLTAAEAQAGGSPRTVEGCPTTALHVAARRGWAEAAAALLAAGPLLRPLVGDAAATDAQGNTPLLTLARAAASAPGKQLPQYARVAAQLCAAHTADGAATPGGRTAAQLLLAAAQARGASPADAQALQQLARVAGGGGKEGGQGAE